MRQTFQKNRSTKAPPPSHNTIAPTLHNIDGTEEAQVRTHLLITQLITRIGKVATDQIGRLPFKSSFGTQYLMICYDYDSNSIIFSEFKSREGPELLQAYKKLHIYLIDRGLKPQIQRLNNEVSTTLKRTMKKLQIKYQLVSPHSHQRNPAERAIQTRKDHYISGPSITDKKFPLHLACQLRHQCDITLNMLRSSRLNPRLSAYTQLEGSFNFDTTPLAPQG